MPLARPGEAGVVGSVLSGLGMTEGRSRECGGLRGTKRSDALWWDRDRERVQLPRDEAPALLGAETSGDTGSPFWILCVETVLSPLPAYFL